MRFRRAAVFSVVVSLVAGSLAGLPPVAVSAAPPGGDVTPERTVEVGELPVRPQSRPQMPSWQGSAPVWPTAGSAIVSFGSNASGVDAMVSGAQAPGGLPVTIRTQAKDSGVALSEREEQRLMRGLPLIPSLSPLEVVVEDRAFAKRAGIAGVVLSARPTMSLRGQLQAEVAVGYSAFRHAYGGDWHSRLQLVMLPACALSTPEAPQCQQQTPLASRNDPTMAAVSASVTFSASPIVLALTASAASDNGTWEATSLNQTATWAAGSSGGDFTYSVPMSVPAAPGELTPDTSVSTLRYSSGSVDGLTKSTSTQASWIGEGFADTTPGFVERSFKSCASDGRPAANAGDWCWTGSIPITVVLGGRSTRILWDAVTGWKTEDDSAGWRLELLNGASNGVYAGEYWRITTGDGTQYFFGSRPRGDHGGTMRATVYSNNPGEPCYNANFAWGQCWMAYRWNLDYVIDRHGNTITYRWGLFANKYGANNNTAAYEYDTFSWLHAVEYGANTVAGTTPNARIDYTTAYRCFYTQVQCDTAGNDWMWPDSPRDKLCALWLTSCPNNKSQTFFSLYRLQKISTRVWTGGAWSAPIDEMTLTHEFPATGDFVPPAGDDTSPSLFLRFVDRTGWPQIRFDAIGKHNRVHWSTSNGLAPMHHYRVNLITTGTGEQISVDYSNADCTSSSFPGGQADNNNRLCFPQYLSLGGDSGWSWFHKYRADGVWSHDLTGGGPSEHWSYSYNTASSSSNVLWAFDRNQLESNLSLRSWTRWAGYSNVITVHGTMGGPIQTTESLYYRGLHGDRTSAGGWAARSVTISDWDPPHHDLPALAGMLRNTVTFDGFKASDGSNWKTAVIHKQGLTLTGSQNLPYGDPPVQAHRVRESSKVTAAVASTAAGGTRWTEIAYGYDGYGRQISQSDWGDTAAGVNGDNRCTTTTYTQNTTLWLIDFPTGSTTTNCAASPGDADILAGSRTFYDNNTGHGVIGSRGLVTKAEALSNVVSGVKTWQQTGRATFDAYGRTLDAFDALDRKTTTEYAPATGRPATVATKTYPAVGQTWTTTTHLSPLRSQPVKIVDMNGKVSLAEYEPDGRLKSVWLNNRAASLPTGVTPDIWYGYWLRADGPNLVHTKVLGPDGQQIQSYKLYDGRLRPRQTHTPSATGTGRVITDTTYNAIGAVAKTSTFHSMTGFVGCNCTLATYSDASVDVQQRFSYDNFGRQTLAQPYTLGNPRGAGWNTTTVYDGDRQTAVTPPTGGTATTTILDARGNSLALLQHEGGTPAGIFTTTSYTYDNLDRLKLVTDPAGNTWSYSYDRRGRRYQTVDPDAGTSFVNFDAAGQITSTTDARGQQLWYEYDPLGRKTKQLAGSAAGTMLASWTYDTLPNAKGKLTSSSRFVGADTYTRAVGSYDDAYRPLSTTDTVPGFGTGGGTLTYTVTNTYRASGALNTVALPAVGGLPAETLAYGYTAEGLPTTITSAQGTYLASNVYSYDGLVVEQRRGAPGKEVKVTNQLEAAGRRLQVQTVFTESQTTPGDFGTAKYAADYNYDPAGNVVYSGTLTNTVRDQLECFRYDHLRRLTEAWSQAALGAGCSTPQRAGADPYWRKWSFDTIGNRITQTDKNTTTGDTTWTSTIGAAGGVKPHQIQQITSAGPLAGPTRSFSYDLAGNTLSHGSAAGPALALLWDEEGHLKTATPAGGSTTTYTYDTEGRRLVASSPAKKTLYLSDGTELEKLGTANPLGTRHYNGAAVRDAGGLKWVTANHQNSSTIQIDAVTLSSVRRRFMPYGEPRGAQPAGWLGTKAFVEGTKDDTGLTHLGAREYDPTTGRFVSADPIMDLSDPQQWHAYTYADASPVTFSDPSGLLKKEKESAALTTPLRKETVIDFMEGLQDGWDNWLADTAKGLFETTIALSTDSQGHAEMVAEEFMYYTRLANGDMKAAGICMLTGVCDIAMDFSMGNYYDAGYATGGLGMDVTVSAITAPVGGGITTRLATRTAQLGRRGGSFFCSFSATTAVLMADGTTKEISQIVPGDSVKAVDPQTGAEGARPVSYMWAHDDDLFELATDEGIIETTEDHPFWNVTDQAWQPAEDLDPGDKLLAADGQEVAVIGLDTSSPTRAAAYNLTVSEIHTYYVLVGEAPVLVHNECPHPIYIKTGQQAKGPAYKLAPAEMQFVTDLYRAKPNFKVYRTHGKNSQGDFLVVDYSNPAKPVGWVVELKSASGGFPGEQFRNAASLKSQFGLSQIRYVAGTPAEMLKTLNVGRGSWG